MNLARRRRDDAVRPRADRRVELWRGLESNFAAGHGSKQVLGARAVGERAVAMLSLRDLLAADRAALTQAGNEVRAAWRAPRARRLGPGVYPALIRQERCEHIVEEIAAELRRAHVLIPDLQ